MTFTRKLKIRKYGIADGYDDKAIRNVETWAGDKLSFLLKSQISFELYSFLVEHKIEEQRCLRNG